MSSAPIVARAEWMHGLVACPSCGLPLDAQSDRGEYLWSTTESKSYGVVGTHRRCGARFELHFDDMAGER